MSQENAVMSQTSPKFYYKTGVCEKRVQFWGASRFPTSTSVHSPVSTPAN